MTGRSVVTYRIGGREYPLYTSRQCKVCMSPHRFDIEEQIVLGRVYGRIVSSLPDNHNLSINNVKDHYYNGHMPLDTEGTRNIVERRARKVGRAIEKGNEDLVDGIVLMEAVVQRTFEAIARGEIEPTVMNGLRAARTLAELGEYEQSGMDQSEMVEAFMAYHETAEQLLPKELFEKFGEALNEHPVLKALASRYEGEEPAEEPEEVQGEVLATRDG